jgi:hypothetical protein
MTPDSLRSLLAADRPLILALFASRLSPFAFNPIASRRVFCDVMRNDDRPIGRAFHAGAVPPPARLSDGNPKTGAVFVQCGYNMFLHSEGTA